jgi:hypothetical protein
MSYTHRAKGREQRAWHGVPVEPVSGWPVGRFKSSMEQRAWSMAQRAWRMV